MSTLHTWEKVDAYLTERLIQQDSILDRVLANNKQADLPAIDVAPNQGKLLNLYARMIGAERILEIGTLGGYSTIWMARALPEHGKLITLELDPHHASVAGHNIALAGLSQKVEIRVGEALEQLEKLEEEGTAAFDLIFIDADKPNNPHYLQWALRFSRPGTVILADNIVRKGEVTNRHSTDPRVQGVRKFIDLLAEEPRITATAVQTVGVKGYDGFAMGIVKS
ncbi:MULTISPECIES: O-methyltransferase [unclassified Paenibacillus]|uniref:O-methyltransferase n=1 Tax=unclassified Paenibacillus TaxID=185978 RepID=UPI0010497DFD|nr:MULTISPECIES: O-methyltransferase [unclassified Paenibacillus]NIK70864.1 putative O-methyltransferase YrrM [Paenibacillus sp. BK720]TCM93158.1 putative O-methyltransferase YrrM [Paenibacillus sp. BK033]